MSTTTDDPTIERRRENVEATDPERALEADPPSSSGFPTSDEGPEPETDDPVAHSGALFDGTVYDTEELALPKIDGEGIDKLRAQFGGTVWLDRTNPDDVALIRDLKLGQTVTLKVEATVGPPVPGYTTNREGDLDTLTLGRTFKVTGVYRPAAEDL